MQSMRLAVVLLGLVTTAAGPAVPPGVAAPPPDPEIEVIATSLLSSERAGVEKAVGGLAALPRYRLDLEIDPEARTFKGTEQIVYPAGAPLSELYYRIGANAPFLDQGQGQAVTVGKVTVNGQPCAPDSRENGLYRLPLPAETAPNATLELQLELSGILPTVEAEAGPSTNALMAQAFSMFAGNLAQPVKKGDHGAFSSVGGLTSLHGFFPEITRRDGAVFDIDADAGNGEPRWSPLANYVVSVVVPPSFLVAGSGSEVGSAPEKDGRRRFTRVAAASRGFALLLSDSLVEQKASAGPVRLRILARKEHALQARKALDVASRSLKFFSEKFGPYPWADLELAAMPLSDGVEAAAFPGLVGVSGLLLDPSVASSLRGLTPDPEAMSDGVLELLIAHQVAHQWFRGVVGGDHQAHPAYDEPVACFASLLYQEHRRGAAAGKAAVEKQFRTAYGLYRMMGAQDLPMDRPISEYGGRSEQEALLHGKGTFYFLALRKLLGEETLLKALRAHVTRNRFRHLEDDGVVVAIAGVAPQKAQAALRLHDRYLRQTRGDEDLGAPKSMSQLMQGQGMQVDPQTKALLDALMGGMMGAGGPPPAVKQAPPPRPSGP